MLGDDLKSTQLRRWRGEGAEGTAVLPSVRMMIPRR